MPKTTINPCQTISTVPLLPKGAQGAQGFRVEGRGGQGQGQEQGGREGGEDQGGWELRADYISGLEKVIELAEKSSWKSVPRHSLSSASFPLVVRLPQLWLPLNP